MSWNFGEAIGKWAIDCLFNIDLSLDTNTMWYHTACYKGVLECNISYSGLCLLFYFINVHRTRFLPLMVMYIHFYIHYILLKMWTSSTVLLHYLEFPHHIFHYAGALRCGGFMPACFIHLYEVTSRSVVCSFFSPCCWESWGPSLIEIGHKTH